jgi:hypothetical protein
LGNGQKKELFERTTPGKKYNHAKYITSLSQIAQKNIVTLTIFYNKCQEKESGKRTFF